MLNCMQNINFITHFFLKILQRNNELAILGNLAILGLTTLYCINLKKPLMFICCQKIDFILVFLEILQRYRKIVILGTLGMPWLCVSKVVISICRKTFLFISWQKINFISHIFLEILQRHANFLYWVCWA